MACFLVHHQLLELAQTHVCRIGDAIQPPHLLFPFSSCLHSFPASGSILMRQLVTSGGQSIGASASVLPMNIQDWFPLGWTRLISLQSKGLKIFLQHHSSKESILQCSVFFMAHPYMTTGKAIALTRQAFVGKVMSLLFNMLSRFFIAFLSRSKHSFNFMTAVTICGDFGAQENKVCHCSYCLFIY